MHADGRLVQRRWALVCLLCFSSIAGAQPTSEALRQAQQLAWKKELAAAEKAYGEVQRDFPGSRDATDELAEVVLGEGWYPGDGRLFAHVRHWKASGYE